MKRFLLTALRILISFGLLGYLIYLADFRKILSVIQRADPVEVGLAVLCFLAALLLLSLRWHLLLVFRKQSPGYRLLVAYYFIGYFFNNFLPTSIGGDLTRIYNLARAAGDRSLAIGTVLLERLLGVLAMLTLGSISLTWAIAYFNTWIILVLTISLMLMVIFVLAILLHPAGHRRTTRVLKRVALFDLGRKVSDVLHAVHEYRNTRRAILWGFTVSLCAQLMLIMMNFLLARALDLQEVTLGYLFLVVPVTFVLGMLPSINGLGVRDYGYKELLARIGVDSAQALSLSFLNTLVPMALSLVGGVLLLFYRHPAAEDAGGTAN